MSSQEAPKNRPSVRQYRKKAPWIVEIPPIAALARPPLDTYPDTLFEHVKNVLLSALSEWSRLNGFDPPQIAGYQLDSWAGDNSSIGSMRHLFWFHQDLFQLAHSAYLDFCSNSRWMDQVHVVGSETGAYLALKILELFGKCGLSLREHSHSEFCDVFRKILRGDAFEHTVGERDRLTSFRCVVLIEPSLPTPSLLSKILRSRLSGVDNLVTAADHLFLSDPERRPANYEKVKPPTSATPPLPGLRDRFLPSDKPISSDLSLFQLLPRMDAICQGEVSAMTNPELLALEADMSDIDRLVKLKVKAGYVRCILDRGLFNLELRQRTYEIVRSWPNAEQLGLECMSAVWPTWDDEKKQLEIDLDSDANVLAALRATQGSPCQKMHMSEDAHNLGELVDEKQPLLEICEENPRNLMF